MTVDKETPMISTAAHEIFLPGCFVILQGIDGDGLANTIETVPEYTGPEEENAENAGEEGHEDISGEVPPLEEDHFRPNAQLRNTEQSEEAVSLAVCPERNHEAEHILAVEETPSESQSSENLRQQAIPPTSYMSSLAGGGLLWRTAGSTRPTCALNNPQARGARSGTTQIPRQERTSTPPPNQPEDFVVVSSEPNTPTRIRMYATPGGNNRQRSKRKDEAIQAWAEECWQRQRRTRSEWRLQQQQQQQMQLQTQTRQQQEATMDGNPNTPTPPHAIRRTSSVQAQAEEDWWLDPTTGYIAIFEEIPQLSEHSVVTGRRIGHLPPGSTVVATKLYTLDSETLDVVRVDAGSEDDKPQQPQIPSIGCIQVLELQLNSNSLTKSDHSKDEDDDLRIDETGYCVYSVHGYAFMVPGIPTMYMDPKIWWWRVTCRVGAFLRQGLELSSDHHCTIPFGSFVQVTRKTVNRMGLSRLRVIAQYEGQTVEGWCSEFLNPLSGQRGHVVQPLPFPVPAIYRVTLEEGAVIREQIELSSRQIGHAPCGTLLTIIQRQFSEHPQDQCVERLKLAGRDSGWISVRLNQLPPHNRCVVELVGVDPRFDPNNPGDFHWDVLTEEYTRYQEEGGAPPRRTTSSGDISSVDDGTGSNSSDDNYPRNTKTTSADKAKQESSKSKRHSTETCLICLTEERNATIVHGETGHIACCLICARILKARGDRVS